eukprot:8207531-Alexandrium_andersonii.AAC.1
MSASLVGSEMCIRDSFCCTTAHRSLPLRFRLRSRRRSGAQPRTARPIPAVSYTHLTLPTICSV